MSCLMPFVFGRMIDARSIRRRMTIVGVGFAIFMVALPLSSSLTAVAQTDIPPLTGRVMDRAEILSVETERSLTQMLRAHEDSTGNQVVVATVASLQGEDIESFGVRAARSWRIGTDENDNGIVVIVAPEERMVRIEVGYGLEGAVPDVIAARIIRNEFIPEFRDGDFDAGVSAGTVALLDAVEGEYRAESSGTGKPPPLVARILISLGFGIIALLAGSGALLSGRPGRYIILAFLTPFVFVVGLLAGGSPTIGGVAAMLYVCLFIFVSRRPSVMRLRQRVTEVAKKGERVSVDLGPFSVQVGGPSGGGSGRGGAVGGGGFSGGGGSFGGGGASGGW